MAIKPKRLLADLEQHLNILDQLPYALLQLNRRGKVVWANLQANELVGNDPVDQFARDIFPNPLLAEALVAAVNDKETMRLEFRWLRSGSFDLIANIVPLTTKTTQGGRVVLTIQDVTAQRQADRTRVDFVANASHELRTPLSSLVGFIETLQGPAAEDEEARARFLRIMQTETDRMTRLVEDLLSLSRIEMNAASRPTGPINVASILRTVQESMELKAQSYDKEILLDIDGDPIAIGEQDEITQVFWNLTDNAIKYSTPGTAITLKVRTQFKRNTVTVAVKDKSDGIAPQHLNRLTERFYRVDKARSRQIGGTGLGLAIVKHILNRHSGKLAVKSTVGKGSTFKVTLPQFQ